MTTHQTEPTALAALPYGVEIPFVKLLGFELALFEGGQSVLTFTPKPDHLNSYGVAHGGAVMTLLDVTMAVASRSVAKDMGVVTIEMKTSFMRPTRGLVTARGQLMHRTATMAFVTSTVYDAKGAATAHATGTFKYVLRADKKDAPVSTD